MRKQIITTQYAVRVMSETGAQDYASVYGACPQAFDDRLEAQKWADKLSATGNWPNGNPGYEVVDLARAQT